MVWLAGFLTIEPAPWREIGERPDRRARTDLGGHADRVGEGGTLPDPRGPQQAARAHVRPRLDHAAALEVRPRPDLDVPGEAHATVSERGRRVHDPHPGTQPAVQQSPIAH